MTPQPQSAKPPDARYFRGTWPLELSRIRSKTLEASEMLERVVAIMRVLEQLWECQGSVNRQGP